MAAQTVRASDVPRPTREQVLAVEHQVTAAVDGISHLIDQLPASQVERLRVPAEMAVECLDECLARLRGPTFPSQQQEP
jgi:hypothetical protein